MDSENYCCNKNQMYIMSTKASHNRNKLIAALNQFHVPSNRDDVLTFSLCIDLWRLSSFPFRTHHKIAWLRERFLLPTATGDCHRRFGMQRQILKYIFIIHINILYICSAIYAVITFNHAELMRINGTLPNWQENTYFYRNTNFLHAISDVIEV